MEDNTNNHINNVENNTIYNNLLNIPLNLVENVINKEGFGKYLNIDNIEGKNFIISCINDIGLLEGPFCIIGKNNIIIEGTKNAVENLKDLKKVNINAGEFKFKGEIKDFNLYIGEYINNQYKYKGDFEYNKFNGCGTINYINSEDHFYDGTFKNGKYDGGGLLRKNNTHYIGDFHNGLYHGKGTIKENNIVYEGEFQNGIKHGTGIEYNDDNDIVKYIVIYDNNNLISKKNKIEQDYEESLIKINELEEANTELMMNLNEYNTKINELKEKFDDQTCKVCYDKKINIVLTPCNHAPICSTCAANMFRRTGQYNSDRKCPICRRTVTSHIEIIFS